AAAARHTLQREPRGALSRRPLARLRLGRVGTARGLRAAVPGADAQVADLGRRRGGSDLVAGRPDPLLPGRKTDRGGGPRAQPGAAGLAAAEALRAAGPAGLGRAGRRPLPVGAGRARRGHAAAERHPGLDRRPATAGSFTLTGTEAPPD